MQISTRGVYAAGVYSSPSATWLGLLFSLITMALLTTLLLPAHLSASPRSVLEPEGVWEPGLMDCLQVLVAWEFVCVVEIVPV